MQYYWLHYANSCCSQTPLGKKQAINWLLTSALNLHQLIALDYSWAGRDFLFSNSVCNSRDSSQGDADF